MKKIISFILILILALFTLTGCNYKRGIDEYYFIISLGLDKVNNDLIKINVQISSTSSETSSSSSDSSQASNYKIYSVEAHTIDEGITILNNYLNKKINLSHCSTLIISEELAKEGIDTYISTLSNNSELRHSCEVLISSTSSYDIMSKVSNSGEVFSARLYDYLTTSTKYTGFTIQSSFGHFFQALDNDYYQPTAIYIKVSDNTIQPDGIAIFQDNHMIDHLNVSNSIAHLIVTNELESCTITTENNFDVGEKLDLEINLYKNTDIDIEIINGSPLISITAYPEGTIRSSGSSFNYINNKNIKVVESTVNSYFEILLKEYLYNISKKYNSDIVGFEGIYRANFLTKNEFNQYHWDEIFQDSFFDVKINSKINSSNLFNKE